MTNRIWMRLALILTAGLAWPANLSASSDRQGLWHALEKENGSTLFYLVYSKDELRAYTSDWDRINAKFEVTEDLISFRIPVGTTYHIVEAHFDSDGSLSGKYTRPHVQDTWVMNWTALHVSPKTDWQPWDFLKESSGGSINMLESVLKGGPFESQEKFIAFWEKEIEPRYYPLLTVTSYYDPFQPDFRKARLSKLAGYYQTLKSSWQKLASFSEQSPQLVSGVASDLKKLYPWLTLPGHLVIGLSPGDVEYAYAALPVKSPNPRRFTLIDAGWAAADLNPVQSRYFIAQALLLMEQLATSRPDTSIRSAFFQRGVSAYMASRLKYSEDPKDFLYQKEQDEPEREKAFRAFALELSKKFKDKALRVEKDFFMGQHRAASYLFAYDFARMLNRRFELQRLLHGFPYGRLRSEMVAHIEATKEVPQVAEKKSAPSEEAKN